MVKTAATRRIAAGLIPKQSCIAKAMASQQSQHARIKIEEGFGWSKTIGGLPHSRWIGRWKLTQHMHLTAAAS